MLLNGLDIEALKDKFDELKVLDQVAVKVSQYGEDLKSQLKELLQQPKCSLSALFILITQIHFINDLTSGMYIDSQYLNRDARSANELHRRMSLLFCDVDEVKNKFVIYLQEKYPLFLKLAKTQGINDSDLIEPILLLEILESDPQFRVQKTIADRDSGSMVLVLSEVARKIRCAYHGVDINLAEQGISCKDFTTYNMKQMVELFTAHHKRIISEDNIVSDLMKQNDIGMYLKSERYHIRAAATRGAPGIETIKDDINSGRINKVYSYSYEGLIRLPKDSDHPWFKKSVVKHLLNGGVIKLLHPIKRERLQVNHPDKYTMSFIPLEPSFSEYILGDTKVIEVWPNQSEIEIAINDLLFIQSEVDNYLQRTNKANAKVGGDINVIALNQNTHITNVTINQSTTINNTDDKGVKLSDEILKDLETGKQVRKSRRAFGQKAGKQKTEEANENWSATLDAALLKAKENPSKWSASNLAKIVGKDYPKINTGTFRRKIGSDERIRPHLKPSVKAKLKK